VSRGGLRRGVWERECWDDLTTEDLVSSWARSRDGNSHDTHDDVGVHIEVVSLKDIQMTQVEARQQIILS
jgi:hypothetical protein